MKKQPGWALPNLKDAQVRTTKEAVIEKSLFQIPEQIRLLGQGKKYYLRTYGCQANERDSETLAGILEEMNFTAVEHPEDADLILMNTCAIRKNAEDKVLGEIGSLKRLKRKKPDLLFGLCGCMAQEEDVVAKLLETYRHVNLIFGTHNIHRLPELLYDVMVNGNRSVEVLSKEGDVIENLPVRRFGKHKAWVNIMYGCDKFCTYCIVPYTRGKERSRMMEDILEEVRILKAEGFKEITLLGQNVNSYGKDLHMEGGFAGLLEETAKIGIERIRFTTSHPWDFTDEMIDVIARYDNIMPFIHLPVQSGDSDILKIMGRRYTREQYLTLFHKIKERIPYCAISTDIIVGFPGETEEDFCATEALIREVEYMQLFTFIYSKRTGTAAASMPDPTPHKEKTQRIARVLAIQEQVVAKLGGAMVGKTVRALVEGPGREEGTLTARLDNNMTVDFAGGAPVGEFADVRVTGVRGAMLKGELA